ncbi:MAG: hypothetical protein AAB593_01990, partial [Patescibacteria group bacterium]
MKKINYKLIKMERIIFFFDKCKYFGIRKIYYTAYYLYLTVKYATKRPCLLFDLEYYSQQEKERIYKSTIEHLSKISCVNSIIEFGGKKYYIGVSDIDLIIV